MISAHVDVAKDNYIIKLNVNGFTYNLTNFLLRNGAGKNTMYFVSQEIMKDLAVTKAAEFVRDNAKESKSK